MKKDTIRNLITVLLVMATSISLTSCSNSTTSQDSKLSAEITSSIAPVTSTISPETVIPETTAPETVVPETTTPETVSPSSEGYPISEEKTFGISAIDLASNMSETFADQEYENPFTADPTVTELDVSGTGKTTAYTYTVCSGVDFIISESQTSKEVTSVFLFGATAQMTTTEAGIFGSFCAIIVDGFEPNEDMLAVIDQKLNIAQSGFTDGTINVASGSNAMFSYSVIDGQAYLSITAQ